jgi:hypothetical protein
MLAQGADPGFEDERGFRAADAAMGRLRSGAPVYENVAGLLD